MAGGAEALLELLTDADTAKSQRAFQAMLGMKKLDIAGLQRAFSGQTSTPAARSE